MRIARLAVIPEGIGLLRPFKFVFQGLDKAEEIHFQLIDGKTVLHVPLLAIRIVREERSNTGIIGQPICPHIDSHHDIEPEVGEIGHIIGSKRLTTQVCMHIAQTAQAIRGYA